jgi:hypothetical protein
LYNAKQTINVKISINGYKVDILFLQNLHLPLRKIHEKTGIKSYQRKVLWQWGQNDLVFKRLSL